MDDPIPVVEPAPAPVVPKGRTSKDILKSSDFYFLIGVMAGVILLAAVVISVVDRWRRRQPRGESTPLTLNSFREMYENGEITQKEYERIREKMAAKMKKEIGLKKPSDPPAVDPETGAKRTNPTNPPPPAVGSGDPPPQPEPNG